MRICGEDEEKTCSYKNKEIKVDYRTKAFFEKFKNAQKVLKVNSIKNIVSLKFRENVTHSEYSHFIDFIKHDMMLNIVQLKGNFQGQAWLVTDNKGNKNVLVEHETGLEILFIAGSIASIIGLLPLLNSGWKFFRRKYRERPPSLQAINSVELRKFDSNNLLIEQQIPSIENYFFSIYLVEYNKLTEKVDKIEQELNDLKRALNEQNNKPKKRAIIKRKQPKPKKKSGPPH